MTTHDVADRYVEALARTDADAAAIAGLPSPGPLPLLSPDAFDDRVDAARTARAALSQGESSVGDDLALVLAERLDAEIDLVDCGFTERLLAPLATPVDAVRSTFDQLPRDTDDRLARRRRCAHRGHRRPHGLPRHAPTLRPARSRRRRPAGAPDRRALPRMGAPRRLLRRAGGWRSPGLRRGRHRGGGATPPPRRCASPTTSSGRSCPWPRRRTPWAPTSTPIRPAPSSGATSTSSRPTPGAGASSTASPTRPTSSPGSCTPTGSSPRSRPSTVTRPGCSGRPRRWSGG